MSFIAKGFEPDINALKYRLRHWFRFDHIRPEQGIALLIGLDASDVYVNAIANWGKDKSEDESMLSFGISLLNGDEITSCPQGGREGESGFEFCPLDKVDEFREEARSRFQSFRIKHNRLLQYWNSGKHPDCTPLLYYIEWSLSKDCPPAWLNRAIEFGLYTPKPDIKLTAENKPLSTTERATLLTIIAALCEYSGIKYQERGTAARIARLTEASGAPVSEDAISKALKKIPNALEARMK